MQAFFRFYGILLWSPAPLPAECLPSLTIANIQRICNKNRTKIRPKIGTMPLWSDALVILYIGNLFWFG